MEKVRPLRSLTSRRRFLGSAGVTTLVSTSPPSLADTTAQMFRPRRPSSARLADKPEDFAKLGIQPGRIEAFEDGMRTEGGPGGYEWWYFDSHLTTAHCW